MNDFDYRYGYCEPRFIQIADELGIEYSPKPFTELDHWLFDHDGFVELAARFRKHLIDMLNRDK